MKTYIIVCIVMLITATTQAQQMDTISNERFSIHAQTTVIKQFKPGFTVKYSGANSLQATAEDQTSITATLYAGVGLWTGGSLFINPEIAGGSGLSSAMGVADALNGETYRIGNPAPQLTLARLYFHQILALSGTGKYQPTDFNQLAGKIPDRHIALTIGKTSITDYFDANKYSHDPRTQFMAWSLMDNGAWDYPANTHGYTGTIIVEYVSPKNEWRYAASLLPLIANGEALNGAVSQALSHSIEYTRNYAINGKDGSIRLLGYFSKANMGNYRLSIEQQPVNPDITLTRQNGRTKYGFGVNAEQDITPDLGCFLRAGWSDGHNETWCFTEIDRTLSGGLSLTGKRWKRESDNIGLAYVISGLSKDHRDYLKAGGNGFILGDGNLNYAPEHLVEVYYSAELKKNLLYMTGTYQFLINPGFNKDRSGPVNVFSIRVHARL